MGTVRSRGPADRERQQPSNRKTPWKREHKDAEVFARGGVVRLVKSIVFDESSIGVRHGAKTGDEQLNPPRQGSDAKHTGESREPNAGLGPVERWQREFHFLFECFEGFGSAET